MKPRFNIGDRVNGGVFTVRYGTITNIVGDYAYVKYDGCAGEDISIHVSWLTKIEPARLKRKEIRERLEEIGGYTDLMCVLIDLEKLIEEI